MNGTLECAATTQTRLPLNDGRANEIIEQRRRRLKAFGLEGASATRLRALSIFIPEPRFPSIFAKRETKQNTNSQAEVPLSARLSALKLHRRGAEAARQWDSRPKETNQREPRVER